MVGHHRLFLCYGASARSQVTVCQVGWGGWSAPQAVRPTAAQATDGAGGSRGVGTLMSVIRRALAERREGPCILQPLDYPLLTFQVHD
jgi:hypothetical protein